MRVRSYGGHAAVGVLVLAAAFAHFESACGSNGDDGNGGSGNPNDASLTDDGSGFGDGAVIAIDSLTIDPPEATLTVSGTATKTQQFHAIGHTPGGGTQQVPATFTVDNAAPGGIDGNGLYTTNNQAGGLVNVTATYGGKTATAKLTIVLDTTLTSGTVPNNAADLFDPSKNTVVTTGASLPKLVYPVPETMFPQNVYRVLFNWRPAGSKLFMLKFESPTLTMRVYTDGVHAVCTQAGTGGSCWESDQPSWVTLAASNAGQSVNVTIQGVDPAAPGKIQSAAPFVIRFSEKPVPGAIYYWSTTAAGVRRGALGDAAPKNFLTPNETGGKCVACHTLSRNGKRLAADVGGENLWVVDVVPTVPPPAIFKNYNGSSISNAWATFSPDTSRVVSAKGGVLHLRDGNTGAPIGANVGALDLGGTHGTMPDWAPDGKHLVYVDTGGNAKDRGLTTSSIAWLSINGDAFSNKEMLFTSTGTTDNYAYPMFDPASTFLAFAHGNKSTDNDATSQIFVAPAQVGATKQALDRANTLVNDTTQATGQQNSMPTWAPTTDSGLRWVAFTSRRDYGTVLTSGSTYGSQMDQLWIAAIDASKIGTGADPSYPAFRVPFTELDENCHRPFWAEDVLGPSFGNDAGAPDTGAPDAATCLPSGADCSNGTFCCVGYQCLPSGDTYTCQTPIK